MYTPRAFAETDLARLDALIARDAFVTLITGRDDGTPEVSHLPVRYARDGARIVLEGHWARPNPQARHSGKALAIVHGPHAYVSPSAYPDKAQAARVPTWNYAVAHLHGVLERIEDTDALADLVDRLSAHFEASVGRDWRFEYEDPRLVRQLAGIVGFRLVVERIELKFKLSQNHPRVNQQAVIDDLSTRADSAAHEVAALMRGSIDTAD
ncbi:FMN-binding negative transcriptional regulator [Pseudoxanthomonas sp. X-1]|uniref:FMN-binding negative transcriptional regulator n=1 Tax=Pseudoxanthomonas sp. X-1 TaxID=2571115 RepID=UPI00110C18D9|nr:FMN-binding negative transcriptional regulator [Pseudoxanthomonas sp. X-1]TMN25873.1 FMN-binding negative transcriptional regulator [Pseudoxanthomonas sp. X-1]UAY72864.1 FMN-binding negative transcriptional regulator [Pseudoxanthomonas sp. X-1]